MEPTDQNRRAFDEAYARRRGAARAGLPPIVKATFGDLTGKRVLDLQAGSGEASAELAEQGAVVTAVDPSEAALDAARERWPKILWIHADAQSLPAELRRGRFDLVYSPEGVLSRLPDLDAWARGIVDALHEGGELLVYDNHPVALCVDPFQRWQRDYFGEGVWRLGAVVSALARVRFRVEALEEYPGERRVPGTFLLYASRRAQ
jgi:SAM-dependent methyltransferase